jgi:hypothetical protein
MIVECLHVAREGELQARMKVAVVADEGDSLEPLEIRLLDRGRPGLSASSPERVAPHAAAWEVTGDERHGMRAVLRGRVDTDRLARLALHFLAEARREIHAPSGEAVEPGHHQGIALYELLHRARQGCDDCGAGRETR